MNNELIRGSKNAAPPSVWSPSFGFVEINSAAFSIIKAGMKGEVWDEQSVCSALLLILQRSRASGHGEQFTDGSCRPILASLPPLSKKDRGRFVTQDVRLKGLSLLPC